MSKRAFIVVLACSALVIPAVTTAQEFVQVAKLLVDDVTAGIELGRRVAITGETVVIGDPGNAEQGVDVGAAYVFIRDGANWVLRDKLLADDGASGNVESFGWSVAAFDDTIVVGSSSDDERATDAGAVYVFVRNGDTWSQQGKLMANDASAGDGLGRSVAIEGDTIVAGATGNDESASGVGAAYVFVRLGNQWFQQDKLIASTSRDFDRLGSSVAISGDTALVGADGCCVAGGLDDTGAVFVFVRSGSEWNQQARLMSDDGARQDAFGFSVAVTGDSALIGAPQDRVNGSFSGSVYVFERSGTTWTQEDKLLPDAEDGFFGASVSRSGDIALFGAMQDVDPAHPGGAAYIFELTESGWVQQQKFSSDNGDSGDAFGFSSSLSDGTAVIGARGDDDLGEEAGASYVFRIIRFDDVPSDHWAFSFIERLYGSGVTSGCGPRLYCPENSVTRAQMAVFLERGINGGGFQPPAASGNVFLDVAATDFAAGFIEQLLSDGITAGCGNNNFCPDDPVTRAQMAVFLLRAKFGSGFSPPAATGLFTDVPIGSFAANFIEQLAAEGITAGCGNGNYCQNQVVTRAQMAVFLVRTFGL